MAFQFDLKKFKKIDMDKHTTTLRHPDGHEIKISHNSLTPKMRGQLAELPMHEPQKMAKGGAPDPEFQGDGGEGKDYSAKDQHQGPPPGSAVSTPDNTMDKAQQRQKTEDYFNGKAKGGTVKMDEGGQPSEAQRKQMNKGDLASDYGPNKRQQDATTGSEIEQDKTHGIWNGQQNFADGGDVVDQNKAYMAKKYPKLDNEEGTNRQKAQSDDHVSQDAQGQAETHANSYDLNESTRGEQGEKRPVSSAEQRQSMVDAVSKAKGGLVNNPKLAESKKMPPPARRYADGGEVDTADAITADAMANPPNATQAAPVTDAPAMPNIPGAFMPKLGMDVAKGILNFGRGALHDVAGIGPGNPQPEAAPAPDAAAPASPQGQPTAEAPPTPGEKAVTQSDPYGTEAFSGAYTHGINEQKQGMRQEAAARGEEGDAQAAVLDKQIQNQQAMANDYQNHYGTLEQERQDFMHDISHNLIDPEHYMNTLGTVGKIKTAIALIAGGFGGGGSGQANGGAAMLQDHINRDVAAQQANLGARESLLSANLKQFGNLRDATDMTRVMQADVTSNMLKKAAAQAQSPLAKASLLQQAGKLDADSAPILSQIAMRKTLLNGMNAGQTPPSSVVRMIVPEHQQAAAYKELQTAENMSKIRDSLMGAFDQVAKINTIGNHLINPIQASRQANAITGPLIEQLAKDNEGRVTPETVKYLQALMPMRGDDEESQLIKRVKLNQFVSNKMNFPILDAYGIKMGNAGRYNAQGQKKLQLGPPKR